MTPTLLEHGGTVDLWAGWTVVLPPAYHQRNDNGSWSDWGSDWSIDVTIIETGCDKNGSRVMPDVMLGPTVVPTTSGIGWIGNISVTTEMDGDRQVYRMNGKFGAINTIMLCCVSYLSVQQEAWIKEFFNDISHGEYPAT